MTDDTRGKDTLMRQWTMLRLIPRHGKISVQELHDKLARDGYDTTERTIQRDLLAFCGLFPLRLDDREKPYGWSWDKNAKAFDLPGQTLSEAITFAMVEQHLSKLLPSSAVSQLKPHFRTAHARLNQEPKPSGGRSWLDKVRSVPPTQTLIAPEINPSVQDVISRGLLEECQVALHYRERGTRKLKAYRIHPLALVQRGTLIYLYCRIFDYDDARILAMHRIVDAELLDERAVYPENFSLDATIDKGVWGFGSGNIAEVELLFAAPAAIHLHESPLSKDQRIEELPDNRVRVTATVPDTRQLRWWLCGFADSVEVVKPIELRAAMAESSQRLAEMYAKDAA